MSVKLFKWPEPKQIHLSLLKYKRFIAAIILSQLCGKDL